MKRISIILAASLVLAACNSGNEGSDSLMMDSLRISDSVKLADSLRIADTAFIMKDDGTNMEPVQKPDSLR